MSRCFPFPPPGYEKKARTEDVDLLKKEKQREKKHKKEKREKKEGKEKRENDRSDGKHREKKDKKEKHKDKKKDREKEREKDKEKNSAPDEKKLPGQAEGHTGEKIIPKEEKDKGKTSIADDKRRVGHLPGYKAEKLSDNSHMARDRTDAKFTQELGRRIKDDDRATESKLGEKCTNINRKKDEELVKLVAKDTYTWPEGKEKNRRNDERKMDGQGLGFEARFSGNSMVQNPAGVSQTRVEGIRGPFEKKDESKVDEKEKTKEKEGDDKRGDKRKDKERDKKIQGKDKERDKDKKKEEKAKVKVDHKKKEHDRIKEINKSDLVVSHNTKTPQFPQDGNKIAGSEDNLRKRKEAESNGVLHASEVRPNKLARPTSSHRSLENGRIIDHFQTPIVNASDTHGAASNLKVDNKERKINGIIGQPSSVSSKKLTVTTAQADPITRATVKPPHPDSKYLGDVYTVPKMGEWSDYDDPEWLFSKNGCQSEKPKVGSSEVEETPQVWAEAMRIESADVCALPYVIPY